MRKNIFSGTVLILATVVVTPTVAAEESTTYATDASSSVQSRHFSQLCSLDPSSHTLARNTCLNTSAVNSNLVGAALRFGLASFFNTTARMALQGNKLTMDFNLAKSNTTLDVGYHF